MGAFLSTRSETEELFQDRMPKALKVSDKSDDASWEVLKNWCIVNWNEVYTYHYFD